MRREAAAGLFVILVLAGWALPSATPGSQEQVSREPDQPGLVKSTFDLVSAILRTVGGGVAGLIRGAVAGL